jgi:hypothetical protein
LRAGFRQLEAEHGVELGPGGVGVDDGDPPAELREVDSQVDGQDALSRATASASDGNHVTNRLWGGFGPPLLVGLERVHGDDLPYI